jgi:(E)-4-hydroxy-3-methyl-but-2-enyl pyrophosphate reductase
VLFIVLICLIQILVKIFIAGTITNQPSVFVRHLLIYSRRFFAASNTANKSGNIKSGDIKMQVLLADEFGFCFGVERAVEMVEKALEAGDTVRTLGPLIHNAQEMDRLAAQGVTTISEPVQIKRSETAVIRAHGVTPQVERELREKAAKVVDATCPFVTKVQKLASRAAAQNRHVVVVGNPEHPEMIGVRGYAPEHAFVVRDADEIENLPNLNNPLVVSQTTIKLKTFLDAAEAVRAKATGETQVINTICSATRDRQDAARALAGEVDAFYVIGGRHSSNSVKLLAVCQEKCPKSFLIETPEEIDPADLQGVERVGVTAGASTPKWLIDKVVEKLKQIGG